MTATICCIWQQFDHQMIWNTRTHLHSSWCYFKGQYTDKETNSWPLHFWNYCIVMWLTRKIAIISVLYVYFLLTFPSTSFLCFLSTSVSHKEKKSKRERVGETGLSEADGLFNSSSTWLAGRNWKKQFSWSVEFLSCLFSPFFQWSSLGESDVRQEPKHHTQTTGLIQMSKVLVDPCRK